MGRIVVSCVRVRMGQNVPMLMAAAFVIKDGRVKIVLKGFVHQDCMVKRVRIVASATKKIQKCKYII